ncbi:AAA family ATPase [Dyadobacter sp. 3J3]|uniref:AAA family ATPase n=1 Tax=Dyadobacter sp. 3J3 TaxID=2606600 RepID=UPI00135C3148|nr:AAA family ATPase [Dyadobacter sp. 3J3]
MKIKKLHIKNFKSLVDLEIVEPNPFTVFVGANGVGKSNIFEALEFVSYSKTPNLVDLFGGITSVMTFGKSSLPEISIEAFDIEYSISIDDEDYISGVKVNSLPGSKDVKEYLNSQQKKISFELINKISRIFIGKYNYLKVKLDGESRLNLACTNLEKVLKRLLSDENKREEITEYLQLLIPGFEKVEIHSDNIGGTDSLLIYEVDSKKPFTKNLISDGTYNIICLLTAVFQSDEPQFLCIEEPENGLSPYAIEVLVEMFRSKCEDNGHIIWLNTHSQTLVRHLKEDEMILVNKIDGKTQIKQLEKGAFYGLNADEAWLTNALGAGLPW